MKAKLINAPLKRLANQPPRLERWADAGIFIGLLLATFLLYLPTLHDVFLDYDDPQYIGVPMVQRGFTWEGVRWAFTTTTFANWLPVTWLSHMLDYQVWGGNPAGHHATSIAIHALNSALVFVLIRALTGARGRSAAVAAIFAFHPLRVESVAWIAERKDVLCALFGLLTILTYVRYSRRPSWSRYGLVMVLLALGLMAKTMLVTLPGVLLLLDFWPLGRMGAGGIHPTLPAWRDTSTSTKARQPDSSARRLAWLAIEKIPFALESLAASVWTMVLQRDQGAMSLGQQLTPGQRIANAFVAAAAYVVKSIRPVDLSGFYPHPGSWPFWRVGTSVAVLTGITILALVLMRRRPYLFVGWFWYLGMLLPVCGIIQVGLQSMADRYTYLPAIGLTVAAVWGIGDLLMRFPRAQALAVPALAGVLLALIAATWIQQSYWASTLDLFEHALEVDPNNYLANDMVGLVRAAGGDDAGALAYYQKSMAARPGFFDAHQNAAVSLDRLGRRADAIGQYREAISIDSQFSASHLGLAVDLAADGNFASAGVEFETAARLDPYNPNVWSAWADALHRQGRDREAAQRYQIALRIDPNCAPALAGMAGLSIAKPPATAPAPPAARVKR